MLCVIDTETDVRQTFPGPPAPEVPIYETKRIPDAAGVYFAYKEDRNSGWECVYVGESKRMRGRLANRPELTGLTLGFVVCEPRERKRLESLYIAALNPKMNSQSSQCQGPASADLDVCELVYEETESLISERKKERVHYKTVARQAHMRQSMVKAAWKMLAGNGRLEVYGDFAAIPNAQRFPGTKGFIVLENGLSEPSGKSHAWNGKDTACRMWSTGGLPRHKRWGYYAETPTAMCSQCNCAMNRR